MTLYGERENVVRPILQIAMPRLPRIYAPGVTMHVVARCNNREFYFNLNPATGNPIWDWVPDTFREIRL